MSRQLNVNLVFNADVSQARTQMQGLMTSVNQLQTSLNSKMSASGLTTELNKAQAAVVNLKSNLNSAFDVNTGKLDLNKFNTNLQRSGMTLRDYRNNLTLLGADGQKAFYQLSQSIMSGQMPLQKTNNLLTNMMNTFGNSIKWSIAYGAINKISQGFQDAFQYAQDLDKSLTSIGVVTGKSTDEMAQFAEQANKAAKALATSTTAYTDAALIYYQQGLDGKAVEERTNTTIKLANVTGESAQTVSQWMTSVWNNFDDGSKSLEYYADVMARLGAETASSSAEIAEGFEKFAAVADTIDLSYEYGASAIAAVTAKTRQSADVVGTAFKTLFARIEDLELGKTLDDGTTLGQYSQALAKVGVNIKDTSGELKSMDTILDEMGATWTTLGKDQQVALAQSVAGVRQYTQLIALMDNYDYFKSLTDSANNAEGTLESQQNRWAEGWEASSKRVKAAAEDVYKSLIDNEFFSDLNNVFADFLGGADDFLEAIGGLKTLIPLVGGAILSAFGPAALTAVQNFTASIKGASAAQVEQAASLRSSVLSEATLMAGQGDSYAGYGVQSSLQSQKAILEEIENIKHRLNQAQTTEIQHLLNTNENWRNVVMQAAEYLDTLIQVNEQMSHQGKLAGREANAQKEDFLNQVVGDDNKAAMKEAFTKAETRVQNAASAQTSIESFVASGKGANAEGAQAILDNLNKGVGMAKHQAIGKKNLTALENIANGGEIDPKDLEILQKNLSGVNVKSKVLDKTSQDLTKATKQYGTSVKNGQQEINKYVQNLDKANPVLKDTTVAEQNLEKQQENLKNNTADTIDVLKGYQKMPLGQSLIQGAAAMGQAAAGASMLYSGLSSLFDMFIASKSSINTMSSIMS